MRLKTPILVQAQTGLQPIIPGDLNHFSQGIKPLKRCAVCARQYALENLLLLPQIIEHAAMMAIIVDQQDAHCDAEEHQPETPVRLQPTP
ncbi:hypothetical protein D9M71_563670 [compost metagenome]